MLRGLVAMTFSGWVATLAGWYVTEIGRQPYVGRSAFAHKAGLHASAIKVDANLYQHIDPALVGNDMRMLVSGMSGRANVLLKAGELGFDYMLNEHALFNMAVWYMDIDTKASVNGPTALGYSKTKVDVDVDPWVYMVGLGYKF